MKRLFFSSCIAILLLAACNNNKSKDNSAKSDKDTAAINPVAKQDVPDDIEKIKKGLEELAPLTLDQLKALIPETLMGVNHKEVDAKEVMGANLATADYQLNDSMDVKLTIYDCAGSGGAGIFNMQYMGMLNAEADTEDEYTKPVDFNGGKAFEHCDKSSNECTFTWLAGGRFLVSLEGDNVKMEALKQTARGLNIK